MAHIEPALPFDHFSGKLSSKERIVMRTRNGRTHAYAILNPYTGPLAKSRKRAISTFSEAVHLCKTEMSDPDRLAYLQDRYLQYSKAARKNPTRANAKFLGTTSDKFYSTLRGFIIASLSAQLKAE
jgi:hypothetical protein